VADKRETADEYRPTET
jgi:hypothetical protein